jgi:diadenosine tetraphosphate (Ap4A) HIT family hydrolase
MEVRPLRDFRYQIFIAGNHDVDCLVCKKHQNFLSVTGQPIAERGGLLLTHFPVLDGQPPNRGHLLIEPQRHVVDPAELTDQEAGALGTLLRDAIVILQTEGGAEHAYVLRINDKVAHFHCHVVPRYPGTPKEFWGPKLMEWPEFPKLNLEQVQSLSGRLRQKLTLIR